jgi:geranylgeranyl pyrophosphate synthase
MLDVISSKASDESDWKDVIDFVERNGGTSYTRDRAADLAARARSCVEGFDPSPARRSLILLTDRLVSRRK